MSVKCGNVVVSVLWMSLYWKNLCCPWMGWGAAYLLLELQLTISLGCTSKEPCAWNGSPICETLEGYRGPKRSTKSGTTCQPWDSQSPHSHSNTPAQNPNADLRENYCRNPDGEDGPWCYTMDSDIRWQYCFPTCSGKQQFLLKRSEQTGYPLTTQCTVCLDRAETDLRLLLFSGAFTMKRERFFSQ